MSGTVILPMLRLQEAILEEVRSKMAVIASKQDEFNVRISELSSENHILKVKAVQ